MPYHHPVELAHRVAHLDHLARGRYRFGVGIGALPSDRELFGLDAAGATNRRMTFEQTGGFGYLVIVSYDAEQERPAWERSLRLLIDEVFSAGSQRT